MLGGLSSLPFSPTYNDDASLAYQLFTMQPVIQQSAMGHVGRWWRTQAAETDTSTKCGWEKTIAKGQEGQGN